MPACVREEEGRTKIRARDKKHGISTHRGRLKAPPGYGNPRLPMLERGLEEKRRPVTLILWFTGVIKGNRGAIHHNRGAPRRPSCVKDGQGGH